MMTDRIGPPGIRPADIDALDETLRQAFRGLEDLRRLGQLPYRDLPFQEESLSRIEQRAAMLREKYRHILLLGTGGSSLGAQCLLQALGPTAKQPGAIVHVCEDLHPLSWEQLTRFPPEETFLIVVSKSGKTTETLAAFLFFRQWMIEALGADQYRKQVLFVTDPRQGPLRKIAHEEEIEFFPVPPGVGGRYSVLSCVGLLPAACAGIEIQPILAGARRMEERCRKADVWINPAMMSAALHYLADRKQRKLRAIMPYDDRLRAYTDWFNQLWAESLGKLYNLKGEEIRAGTTPLRTEGSIGQHSQLQLYLEGPKDKSVTFIVVDDVPSNLKIPKAYEDHEEFDPLGGKFVQDLLKIQKVATETALSWAGVPNLTIGMRELTPHTLGQLLYLAEEETVFSGALYNINPFDQPGVENIKKFIKGMLGVSGFEEYRQVIEKNPKERRYII